MKLCAFKDISVHPNNTFTDFQRGRKQRKQISFKYNYQTILFNLKINVIIRFTYSYKSLKSPWEAQVHLSGFEPVK